ncbi:GGDEF domain-containing protein [Aurantimonas sp. A2-1-M11]|uniref:GGDEF domain-containing protein n=1 Tax=Aurantimonas sp. A2-1-M11 TaxID=3113712 RepID=UPI002F92CB80
MFEEYVSAFEGIGRPVGLMLLDLDKFKNVNDTFGHGVGDEVLKAVAGCLSEFARHHDVVARLGGEEFAIVVTNMSGQGLVSFAERIRRAVSALTIRVGDVTLPITVSVGLASSAPGDDCAGIFKRADINLYSAKQGGRNRVHAGAGSGIPAGTNA